MAQMYMPQLSFPKSNVIVCKICCLERENNVLNMYKTCFKSVTKFERSVIMFFLQRINFLLNIFSKGD